ncbi:MULTISPECIES: glycoside hydrolase family 9 protein [unclassified Pedobacter]|uniref:glycoside hydrolase family 9 protein n=1 Tax=unclassified Pedobacter TaxID=2628915 RepID=UPI00178E6343|nr:MULTISPECIES: glycoside hydrolase family 9 protein [unclassified Pedobacter]NII83256.1 endoglucanase [Pedobacter sp. SG908]NMN37126.1 endoglucanase [Pedobacter sp. SG918]
MMNCILYRSVLIWLSLVATAAAAQEIKVPDIVLNQSGYYPKLEKSAVVLRAASENKFELLSMPDRKSVYTGVLSEPKTTGYSKINTRIADFSSFNQPGQYIIRIAGGSESPVFKIADGVHHDLAVAALKAFYYQRASAALDANYAGKWYRAAGHPDTSVYIHPSAASKNRKADSKINVAGGWYDAGDYNKYVVNSGISTSTLLSAYEDFSEYFLGLEAHIPHAKNKVPDVLTEAIYNLRWMLKMQDPADGGVYNKCTNLNFDGMIMPDQATSKRYVVAKGTAATLNLAAVAAQAYRIFKQFPEQYPGLADSCLLAAKKAWSWSVKNPSIAYDQDALNKMSDLKVTTGGYGDGNFEDEWTWASAELLASTGQQEYYDAFFARLNAPVSLPSWNNVGTLGYYTLIRCEGQLPEQYKSVTSILKKKILGLADRYLAAFETGPYHTVIGASLYDFAWGSNSLAMNQSILLINTYLFSKKDAYLDAALSNLDYILGKNATGYSFVTGVGYKSPMHPHHRLSFADGVAEPIPGLLVGGPNRGKQDGLKYNDEPELSYLDDVNSYASNEIAINWNAPLVYVANAVECIQKARKK